MKKSSIHGKLAQTNRFIHERYELKVLIVWGLDLPNAHLAYDVQQ